MDKKLNIHPPKEKWESIVTHDANNICGFFGEFRFLSNLWPCKIFYEGDEYSSVENAYQAAKYKKEERGFLKTCSGREAAEYSKDHPITNFTFEEWGTIKLEIMKSLLEQKYDVKQNPELSKLLKETGEKYLEETNYWGDRFWGVEKKNADSITVGENNLGKMLMGIRQI